MLLNTLPYGTCYLCKGNSNKLAYLLQDTPNVIHYQGNNLKLLESIITYDYLNYVVYYSHYLNIPERLMLSPLVRVFLVFTIYDEFTTELKALYKKLQSKSYVAIDYSKITSDKCADITDLSKSIVKTNVSCYLDVESISRVLKHYPYSLQTLLLDSKDGVFNNALNRDIDTTISSGIKSIADTKSYTWVANIDQLPNSIFSELFEGSFNRLADLISTDKELSWGIYYWYKLFYKLYFYKFNLPIKTFVKLYFTWVYQATVRYNEGRKQGLDISIKSNKKTYYFSPSYKAIKVFFSL